MRSLSTTIAAALLALSCSGGSQKPAEGPASESDKAKSSERLSERREKFMAECTGELPGAPDYCECSWSHLVELVGTDDEAWDREPDKETKAAYTEKIAAACAGKIPEELVEKSYMHGCVEDDATREAFCGCTYGELRKSVSIGDLANKASYGSDRFAKVNQAAVQSCMSLIPESMVKAGFLKGCLSKRPNAQKLCDCAYQVVRQRATVAQILTRTADLAKIKPEVDKTCGALAPK